MRIATITLLHLYLGLLLVTCPAWADLPDTIDRIKTGVVGVGTVRPVKQPGAGGLPTNFRGTGFAVADGYHVITNAHVVPENLKTEQGEIYAVFSGEGKDGQVHTATLVETDREHDLALLRIEGRRLPPLILGDTGPARAGQTIAITGFPVGMALGLYPVTHRGIISSHVPMAVPAHSSGLLSAAQLKRLRHPFKVYQLDATAYPGNSGSPVYDPESGRVIGVLNSVLVKESRETLLSQPSAISYAIPVRYIIDLLEQAGVSR